MRTKCIQERTEDCAEGGEEMTDPIKLIRRWLDLAAMGPADAWPECVDENIVIQLPFAPPGVPTGTRGLKQAIDKLAPTWKMKERFEWHDVTIRRTEESELFLTTARSDVMLVTDRHYVNDYVMLTRVRDGKVIEHVEYFNPLKVIEAYGKLQT
jgi:ketosteroid isomerase-like protein